MTTNFMKPTNIIEHRHSASRNKGSQSNHQPSLHQLKQLCPLPVLMEHLGLGRHAKASSKSPVRTDNNASWGIFNSDNGWRFKDHGTGESGDEIALLASHLRLDPHENFLLLLGVYWATAQKVSNARTPDVQSGPSTSLNSAEEPMFLPDRTGFGPGTSEQHRQLARLMGVRVEAVSWAVERGVVVFGEWHGLQCYGVCDQSGRLFEIRRLNGLNFPAVGELQSRTSHTVKHSQENWPVGLSEAKRAVNLLLVEGLADFIAAHEVIVASQLEGQWAPVAMMSAGSISPEALPSFTGKQVLIGCHNDADHQGGQAALNWGKQLQAANCAKVSVVDTRTLAGLAEGGIKDLNVHPSPTPVRELGWRQWLRNQLQHWGLKFNGLSHPALNH